MQARQNDRTDLDDMRQGRACLLIRGLPADLRCSSKVQQLDRPISDFHRPDTTYGLRQRPSSTSMPLATDQMITTDLW